MAITPLEIKNKNFERKFKGYNPDEVDDFLDEIMKDYELLIDRNRELEKEVKHAEEKLEYFNELKESLNKSILVAQDAADRVKDSAEKEAGVIIASANQEAEDILVKSQETAKNTVTQAEEKAREILDDAAKKATNLARETDDLTKKTRSFHQKLKMLMEAQMQLVNNQEWENLVQPFSTFINENHQNVKEILDKEKENALNSNQDEETH